MQFVKITEVLFGALLLINLFVPLSLIVLAPVTLNILLIHIFLDTTGLPVAAVIMLLHLFLGFTYRDSYREILRMK